MDLSVDRLTKWGFACFGALTLLLAAVGASAHADEVPPVFRTLATLSVPSGAMALGRLHKQLPMEQTCL